MRVDSASNLRCGKRIDSHSHGSSHAWTVCNTTRGTPIRQVSVDDAASEIGVAGDVSVLAIDTEGFDSRVLDGAMGLLAARRVRVLCFEYHQARREAHTYVGDGSRVSFG